MIDLEQSEVVPDMWRDVFDSDDVRFCFNCGSCISVCPASTASPPLLIRRLARLVLLGLEDELLDEDTPWSCVSCSRCEEVCPMGVRPFELGLAIRRWQVRNDETRIPPSIVELYKEGYTQPVSKAVKLRASVGLGELPTIDKDPEMLKAYQDMLMATDVVSTNDYMFKG
jgi:heterodisulfide reductase subunit C